MNTVGKRLSALLEFEGMTQRELAARMGIVKSSVHAWCSDRNAPPIHRGITISRNFCVPLDWLYGTIENAEHMTVKDAKNLYEAMNKTTEAFKQRRIRELHRELKELTKES